MSKQGCICRGVELADGWFLDADDEYGKYVGMVNAPFSMYLNEPLHQWMLDALAAQLVRQVDALDTPDTVEITHSSVWVGYRSKNNESWKRTKRTKSRGRTMNTIKAIVDSGVLTVEGSGS